LCLEWGHAAGPQWRHVYLFAFVLHPIIAVSPEASWHIFTKSIALLAGSQAFLYERLVGDERGDVDSAKRLRALQTLVDAAALIRREPKRASFGSLLISVLRHSRPGVNQPDTYRYGAYDPDQNEGSSTN
jgi:hypothetical protein